MRSSRLGTLFLVSTMGTFKEGVSISFFSAEKLDSASFSCNVLGGNFLWCLALNPTRDLIGDFSMSQKTLDTQIDDCLSLLLSTGAVRRCRDILAALWHKKMDLLAL